MSARERENECPTCLSVPGEDCTQPSDTGRKYVSWEHSSRVDARSVFDPVKDPAARTWSGDLVDVFGEQFGAESIVRELQAKLDRIEVAAVVGWLRGRGYSVELVTDNKCDNPPKSIPEDQVDAISVIDKTLDNLEWLDADWTSPEVVELLQDLRGRIVRGYVAPQEPSKWEHGVIGGEDLLARLMDTLAYYHCRSVNPKADSPHLGYHAMSEDQREFLRERQREAAEEVLRMWDAGSSIDLPAERRRLVGELRTARIEGTAWRRLLDRAADALAAPVAVDKAKLAEVLSLHFPKYRQCGGCDATWHSGRSFRDHQADVVAEWLGGGE